MTTKELNFLPLLVLINIKNLVGIAYKIDENGWKRWKAHKRVKSVSTYFHYSFGKLVWLQTEQVYVVERFGVLIHLKLVVRSYLINVIDTLIQT